MRLSFLTRCRVPQNIDAVTSIADDEVKPRLVGADPRAVGRVWDAVQSLYRSGMHPAIQLCVRRRGAVLLHRAIGHASGNAPDAPPGATKVPVTLRTPFNIFSASKAVTAMIVHLLDERNLIRLDDPVCEYIPEFGTHRKQWITIRHVLTHRAGIPNLPPDVMDLDNLQDEAGIVRLLCDARPVWRPGRQLAYHAITGGFVLAEVVRRVTGKSISTVLDEAVRGPLGFRWMRYGVAPQDVALVAHNAFTGPPPLPPLSTVLARLLGVSVRRAIDLSNDPRFLTGVVPSANVVATADELSRFYQLLLNGGELDGVRLFEPRTIRRAIGEQSYREFDFALGLPLRYGMGFMLGGRWLSFYGPDTWRAFGHLGFTNIVSWADPERQLAAALMTSGKPLIYPQIYYAFDVVRQLGLACPKERSRPAPAVRVAVSRRRPTAPRSRPVAARRGARRV